MDDQVKRLRSTPSLVPMADRKTFLFATASRWRKPTGSTTLRESIPSQPKHNRPSNLRMTSFASNTSFCCGQSRSSRVESETCAAS